MIKKNDYEKERFQGRLGEEYALFSLACPHFDTLQETIKKEITKKYESSEKEIIQVLEIGCGSGYTTKKILSADKRITVLAIDNEQVMLSQANELLYSYVENKKLKLIQGDALNYLRELPSQSMNAVVSAFTLHNFRKEYRNKVLTEIYRILTEEGLFINGDKYALDNKFKHKQNLEWQLKQFEKKFSEINRPDLISEWIKHYLEDDKSEVIMRESDSKKELTKIGFKNINLVYREKMEAVLIAIKKGGYKK